MPRPAADEYAKYYDTYVSKVPEDDLLAAFEADFHGDIMLLKKISEEQSLQLHAPYTWTFREVLGHILDAERVFTYRALWIARGDQRPLWGFDEKDFDREAQYKRVPFADLAQEFSVLRASTLCFLKSLPGDAWKRRGVASEVSFTVNALAYIILGHSRHHFAIMSKRLTGAASET
jgi:DinB superfamily